MIARYLDADHVRLDALLTRGAMRTDFSGQLGGQPSRIASAEGSGAALPGSSRAASCPGWAEAEPAPVPDELRARAAASTPPNASTPIRARHSASSPVGPYCIGNGAQATKLQPVSNSSMKCQAARRPTRRPWCAGRSSMVSRISTFEVGRPRTRGPQTPDLARQRVEQRHDVVGHGLAMAVTRLEKRDVLRELVRPDNIGVTLPTREVVPPSSQTMSAWRSSTRHPCRGRYPGTMRVRH